MSTMTVLNMLGIFWSVGDDHYCIAKIDVMVQSIVFGTRKNRKCNGMVSTHSNRNSTMETPSPRSIFPHSKQTKQHICHSFSPSSECNE